MKKIISFLLVFTILQFAFSSQECLKIYSSRAHLKFPGKVLFMKDVNQVGLTRMYLLRKENQEVFASYFVYDGTKVGRIGLAELREARRRGSRVRLIVDGWGVEWWKGGIDNATVAALTAEGVEIRIFNPINGYKYTKWFRENLWHRSHDKLLYLGSQNILFLGDINVQNVNFRRSNSPDRKGMTYTSYEIMTESQVAEVAKEHLEDVWEQSSPVDTSAVTDFEIKKAQKNLDRALFISNKLINGSLSKIINWIARSVSVSKIEFMADDPERKGKDLFLREEHIRAIKKARKRIILFSPFITLDEQYLKALTEIKKNTNLPISVYVPAAELNLNPISALAFMSVASKLAKVGVRVRSVNLSDPLHAKGILIDDDYFNATTHNLNGRSNYIDIESSLIIEDKNIIPSVEDLIEELELNSIDYQQPTDLWTKCKAFAIECLRKLKVFNKQI